jgi:hypothetical protein
VYWIAFYNEFNHIERVNKNMLKLFKNNDYLLITTRISNLHHSYVEFVHFANKAKMHGCEKVYAKALVIANWCKTRKQQLELERNLYHEHD